MSQTRILDTAPTLASKLTKTLPTIASLIDRPWSAVGLMVCFVMLAWLYYPALRALSGVWWSDPNYSHGFLIPVVCLVLCVRLWHRHRVTPVVTNVSFGEMVGGLAVIGCGLLLQPAAWFLGTLLLSVLSLIVLLCGILLLLGGRSAFNVYLFPVTFLVFMAPLPESWYQPVANSLQGVVSAASTACLKFIGIPVFREGYRLQLPNYTMEVAAACSGLRQLTGFLAMSVAAAHVFSRPWPFRFAIVLASVPVAIATNCFRVTVTGVIAFTAGPEWAQGIFHSLEGLVLLVVGFALFGGVVYLLEKMVGSPD